MQTQEIAHHVLLFFSVPEALQLGRTCKAWHKAVDTVIPLALHGYMKEHCKEPNYFTQEEGKLMYNNDHLSACDLNGMFQLLTRVKKLDEKQTSMTIGSFETMMAQTFILFATVKELLDKTLSIYFFDVKEAEAKEKHTSYQSYLLCFWKQIVKHNFVLVKADSKSFGTLLSFVANILATTKQDNTIHVITKQLDTDIREQKCNKDGKLTSVTFSAKSVMDFTDAEIADQLYVYAKRHFIQVPLSEFIMLNWKKENTHAMCPKMLPLLRLTAKLPLYIQLVILSELNIMKRAKLIDRWIGIAKKCYAQNNIFVAGLIVLGITAPAVIRLTETFSKTVKNDSAFQLIVNTFNSEKNYMALRADLKYLPEHGVPSL